MIELVLTAAAITLVLVRGSIFATLRSRGPAIWRELSSCALCAGFWVGALWCALATLRVAPATVDVALQCFEVGALTAAVSLLLLRVVEALEALGGEVG